MPWCCPPCIGECVSTCFCTASVGAPKAPCALLCFGVRACRLEGSVWQGCVFVVWWWWCGADCGRTTAPSSIWCSSWWCMPWWRRESRSPSCTQRGSLRRGWLPCAIVAVARLPPLQEQDGGTMCQRQVRPMSLAPPCPWPVRLPARCGNVACNLCVLAGSNSPHNSPLLTSRRGNIDRLAVRPSPFYSDNEDDRLVSTAACCLFCRSGAVLFFSHPTPPHPTPPPGFPSLSPLLPFSLLLRPEFISIHCCVVQVLPHPQHG